MENNAIDADMQKESAEFINLMKSYEYDSNWKQKEEKPVAVYKMKVMSRKAIKAISILNIPFDQMAKLFAD